ncbi:MAG: putative rane protein [Bacteroidota bacterium]|nr:putative rane protein [Bacteroidota bacterium]
MGVTPNKFDRTIEKVNHYVLKYLILVISVCIFLGAIHLTWLIISQLIHPPYGLLEVDKLLDFFSLALIIVVGYELTKSLSIIVSSEKIPVIKIIQIALTAVANKIITIEKDTSPTYLYGIAALILALSASLFFINFKKGED